MEPLSFMDTDEIEIRKVNNDVHFPSPVKYQLNSSSPYRLTGGNFQLINLESEDNLRKSLSPGWRRPDNVVSGYTGCDPPNVKLPQSLKQDSAFDLESPHKIEKIGGYSGFMPNIKDVCGKPLIPFDHTRINSDLDQSIGTFIRSPGKYDTKSPDRAKLSLKKKLESYHIGIEQRYRDAINLATKDSKEIISLANLVNILQARLTQKVGSFAEQTIYTRKLFELNAKDDPNVLKEYEFSNLLETLNIQLDETQTTVLFSYFDEKFNG